jgi:hypothetical protein
MEDLCATSTSKLKNYNKRMGISQELMVVNHTFGITMAIDSRRWRGNMQITIF